MMNNIGLYILSLFMCIPFSIGSNYFQLLSCTRSTLDPERYMHERFYLYTSLLSRFDTGIRSYWAPSSLLLLCSFSFRLHSLFPVMLNPTRSFPFTATSIIVLLPISTHCHCKFKRNKHKKKHHGPFPLEYHHFVVQRYSLSITTVYLTPEQ